MTDPLTLTPHIKDLGGGFLVRRSLPSAQRQAIGPFLFFDHFGPIVAQPDDNHDVRPHPHIGLATVTYLFEGAMMHRDSTGVVQRIEPGAINWMTAGRGIVHSERTPDDLRGTTHRSHGLQLWCALPAEREADAPRFQHIAAEDIPEATLGGASVRVLVGAAYGLRSPVATLSPTLYVDIRLAPGASIELPDAAAERALYGIDHGCTLDGRQVEPCTMRLLEPGTTPRLEARDGARVVMIGGAPLGHRYMLWNFVASRKELIEQAEDDWDAYAAAVTSGSDAGGGPFGRVPGDASEFIPLPPRRR
ncbi:MAG: pirin family protein [Proteobacteria bacterium]|nr:pirin family protein [Pseudomonadota bacterium]